MLFNETRKGLLKKFLFFAGTAIALAWYGKSRAANYKQGRHVKQTDALVDSEYEEFTNNYYHPGQHEEKGKYARKSEYVGAGSSYSSRKLGDRLTMFKIFDRD